MTNIYAAIEIGTTRTALAVGESTNGERPKVVAFADIPSSGVRKSQIIDLNHAAQSVRSVIAEIEKRTAESGDALAVGNAVLTLTGQHLKADAYSPSTQIDGSKVSDDDIIEVVDAARALPLPKDRELLDIIEQDYAVDAMGGIFSPKGMSGRILKLNTLHIHADRNRVQDARTACDRAHLEVREPIFATTAAADAALDDYERKNGVVVIDLGGGSTGIAAYLDGYPIAIDVLGVGGDHVSSDIAHAFQTTQGQAEDLKINEASCSLAKSEAGEARVKIPGSSAILESRTISRRALDTVVNLRVKELFTIIREKLEDLGIHGRLHSGAVLLGGGAALKGIEDVAATTLALPVRTARKLNIDGFGDIANPFAYAALAGAILYAHRNYEEKPIFKSIFGGLFK